MERKMEWEVTECSSGRVVRFVGDPLPRTTQAPAWSDDHPLVARDVDIAARVHENPIDATIPRVWFFGNKLTTKAPSRHAPEDHDDESE